MDWWENKKVIHCVGVFYLQPKAGKRTREHKSGRGVSPNSPHLLPGLFSSQEFLQNFSDSSSHRIFKHMYEALNIDKNKTNYTV
jgi:hypothetical protein